MCDYRVTRPHEPKCPYFLLVFPYSENRGALLKAVADAGAIPLICHSVAHAEKIIHYESIHTIICEDDIPAEALEAICRLVRKQGKRIRFILMSASNESPEIPLVIEELKN